MSSKALGQFDSRASLRASARPGLQCYTGRRSCSAVGLRGLRLPRSASLRSQTVVGVRRTGLALSVRHGRGLIHRAPAVAGRAYLNTALCTVESNLVVVLCRLNMEAIQQRVDALEEKTKNQLKDLLSSELGSVYNRQITESLRNDFMFACYNQIKPKRNPLKQVESHENYSPSWKKKRSLATALRMTLTENVGHPREQGITSLNKRVLAELIVAIRVSNEDRTKATTKVPESNDSGQKGMAPSRNTPTETPFDNVLLFEQVDGYELYEWISANRTPSSGEHGVYVLDCTPPVGDAERSRMKELRRKAYEKSSNGEQLTKIERAAQAANDNQRIYYVGYASDVPIRVRQHAGGRSAGGATFTNMFKPQALVEATWYETESLARKNEANRAEELTVPNKSYAYWE